MMPFWQPPAGAGANDPPTARGSIFVNRFAFIYKTVLLVWVPITAGSFHRQIVDGATGPEF